MLPAEDELCHEDKPNALEELSEISVVTVNVDGICEYPLSPVQRIPLLLDEVLHSSPHILSTQEVTMPMYAEIQRRAEDYFNVTATNWPGGQIGKQK